MPAPDPPAGDHSTKIRRAAPLRPFGRALSDFGKLSPAESKLLECCRLGAFASISNERPDHENDEVGIRADFIRFLALGGDESAPVHERGLLLQGAWVNGVLDLSAVVIERPLGLWKCRLERIFATDAEFVLLTLVGCKIQAGFLGDRLKCKGGLYLRDGFHSTGEVRLLGVTLGGNLDCQHSCFETEGEDALSCDGAIIHGDVFLRGIRASGTIRFHGCRIGGDLDCEGAKLEGTAGRALICDGSHIENSLMLRNGFSANGTVRIAGSEIGVDVDCRDSTFTNPDSAALSLDCTHISRRLILRDVMITGHLDLSSLHAPDFTDNESVWHNLSGNVLLDGFTYGRFTGDAPTSAAFRIAWLKRQLPVHLNESFRPQPWEQLTAVLRAMGHSDEARIVAIEKQRQLRRAHRFSSGVSLLHWIYGALVGYGYRPVRLVLVTTGIWLTCASAYWLATNPSWFGAATYLIEPAEQEASASCLLARARARSGDPCPPAVVNYETFVPLIYSADVMLPVVDLGYREEWRPVASDRNGHPLFWGQMLRFLYWFEIAFGWVAGLLLVAVLGNLIKRD